jgi:epoxyqueuosine reductase
MSLTQRIRNKAHSLGFDLVGITPAFPVPHLDAYRAWLAQGYHGEMSYMTRPDRVERREDPGKILPGVRSIVCVGLNYYPGTLPDTIRRDASRGLISNYAWGLDYHALMATRLEKLAAFIGAEAGGEVAHRVYVDTGPILERSYAAEAGLGFIGKNTCLINPKMGSWLFLGEVLLNVELEPTPGKTSVSCGTCQRCLDACPTGALIAPYVLDARRCISYLTIELKGPIPHELRPLMSNWVYGCDVCQTVCPWQRFAKPTRERSFHAAEPDRAAPALPDLIMMGEETFRQRHEGTAILRIGRARLLRNAAVTLGNWGDERAIPALVQALTDKEPLVQGHAAWAIGRIGGRGARRILEDALQGETEPYVRHEINIAAESHQTKDQPKGDRQWNSQI